MENLRWPSGAGFLGIVATRLKFLFQIAPYEKGCKD